MACLQMVEKLITVLAWGIFIWSIIEWDDKNSEMWAITLIPLFVFGTWEIEMKKLRVFPSIHRKNICPSCEDYNDDSKNCFCNGYVFALIFRLIALILAIVQLLMISEIENVVWLDIVANISNETHVLPDFLLFYIFGAIASICYMISGIILSISLCQCGNKFSDDGRFVVFIYGLHDLVIGGIWLALSFQFHDVVDDADDSHWRMLFSSMIVIHIISMLVNIWNNKKYNIDWLKVFDMDETKVRIWSDYTREAWFMFFRFLLYCTIYVWILFRLHEYDNLLINQGLTKWGVESIVTCSGLIILINIIDNADDDNVNEYKKLKDKEVIEVQMVKKKNAKVLNF